MYWGVGPLGAAVNSLVFTLCTLGATAFSLAVVWLTLGAATFSGQLFGSPLELLLLSVFILWP